MGMVEQFTVYHNVMSSITPDMRLLYMYRFAILLVLYNFMLSNCIVMICFYTILSYRLRAALNIYTKLVIQIYRIYVNEETILILSCRCRNTNENDYVDIIIINWKNSTPYEGHCQG